MNKERFEKLIKAVEERPEEGLDMYSWCGSTCCAAGCYIEANPQSGMRLSDGWLLPRPELVMNPSGSSYGDLATHFEITPRDAHFLFDPDEYSGPTKTRVLDRLRKFYAKHLHDPAAPEPDASSVTA